MLGPLMKAVRKRKLTQMFLALKGKVSELIHARRVRVTLSAQKLLIQKYIHEKSQSDLKKGIMGLIRTSRTQTRLILGLALRNATRSKYRSFLLIFGVLITVALETGIVISVDTLYDDFILDHRNQNFTDITVHPREWVYLEELRTLAKTVQKVAGVSRASPVYYISANKFLDIRISDRVLVYGIDQGSHPDFTHLEVIEGESEVSEYTVMISESIQDAVNAEIGTPIPISPNYPNLNISEVTVGGVISDELYIGNKLLYYFILVDIETLYAVIPKDQRQLVLTSEIDVSVDNLIRIKQTGENIKDLVGLGNLVYIEKAISEIEVTGILAYQTAMNLVILASFLVEFLFITNVLAIAIKDRSKEFGILRAVGINSGQLIMLIASEILFYAILGSLVGIFAGIGLSTILVGLIDSFYLGIEIQAMSIHPLSLIAAFLSGIIVSLISGLYPIFLALNTPVVQNIHSRMRTAKSSDMISNWKYSIGSGILLSITGFLLQFFVGPTRFLDFSVLSIHFFVIVLIFVGTVLLEIGILVFLPRIGMKVLFYFGTITRIISMRNIAREFQKSLFTVLTTALALAFIIVTGLTSAAVIASVPSYFESQWGNIELIAEVRDNNPVFTNFTNTLDSRFDILKSSFIQETRTEIQGIDGYVFGVDPLKYAYFAEHVIDSQYEGPTYTILNETTQTTINASSGAPITKNVTHGLISHRLYQHFYPQIPLGSNVSLKTSANETINVILSAIIKGNVFLNNGEYFYISSEHFQEFFDSELVKWFVCDVRGEPENVQVSLEYTYSQLKEVMAITFYKELIEESLIFQTAIFQVLFIESLILAAMAQFVCILISTLRMEREMGIMRSLGLRRMTIIGIFMSESTALGLSAIIIGLIDGILGSILLAWYISQSIPVLIQFPLDRVLLWVIFSFMVTLVSTILPSYRSSQKNIIATISGRPMTKMYIERPIKPFIYPDHRERKIPTQVSPIKMDRTSLVAFIKEKKLQIQTIFLILLSVITINYILDANVIIRGLIPFDMIWRLLFTGLFYSYGNFLLINPLLFFVGIAAIGPISYYLYHERLPNSLIKNIIFSLIYGIICCLIWYVSIIILLALFSIISMSFFSASATDTYLIQEATVVSIIILFVIIFIVGLLIFQRIWAFLILRGSNPDINLRDQIWWTRRTAPEGQLGFILLILLHILLQALIYIVTLPQQAPFPVYPMDISSVPSASSDPILFLFLSVFEVGFYLFLIIYQLTQFRKQNHFFLCEIH